MTEPMSKERLKDLKEWGEARGPLLIIRELTDEIDRLREELAIHEREAHEFEAEAVRLRKELLPLLSEKSALTYAVIDLREDNVRLRETIVDLQTRIRQLQEELNKGNEEYRYVTDKWAKLHDLAVEVVKQEQTRLKRGRASQALINLEKALRPT